MSTVAGLGPGRDTGAGPDLASRVMVLLFTDVAGSVQLKETLGMRAYAGLISRHDTLFKSVVSSLRGAEVLQDTGDGFLARFATPSDAVTAAVRFQLGLSHADWRDAALRVRVGLHFGQMAELEPRDGGGSGAKLVGGAIDMASRVMGLAVPGQILMTRGVFDDARQFLRNLPPGEPEPGAAPAGAAEAQPAGEGGGESLPPLEWVAHGAYLFKGHDEPVEVFEVGVAGTSPLAPPPDGEKARRAVSIDEEATLGWRPAVGREIPRRAGWVLQRPLGEGGFGEVWLARHPRTKARRVFKFCFESDRLRSLKRELTLFRLLREALGDRPDVAKLHEVQLDQPPFFLESEFSELGSLSDWAGTRGGIARVALETRLDLMARVADAVAAAHSVGVLHKDIKPGNVLVYAAEDGSPRPRLADFGIAGLSDPDRLSRFAITAAGFTRLAGRDTSATSGSPMYQPPELEAGKPFTVQGDVYALGVMLYQMVTGDLAKPLAEGWERDVADPLLREDVALCVDGDPSRRLGAASELARRLRELGERRKHRAAAEEAARTAARRRRLYRFSLFACIFLTFLLLAVSVASNWHIGKVEAERARAVAGEKEAGRLALLVRRRLADDYNREGIDQLEHGDPAKALLWFSEAMEVDDATQPHDPVRLALDRLRAGMTLRALPRLLHVPAPPDRQMVQELQAAGRVVGGRRLVRAAETVRQLDRPYYELRVVDDETKRDVPLPWPVRHEDPIESFTFSPDGLRIATGSRDRTARVWDARTGRPITPPLWHEGRVEHVAFLPDAPHVLVTMTSKTPRVWDLSYLPGEPTSALALRHEAAVTYAAFSPDAAKVVTAGVDGKARVWSTATGRLLGAPLAHGGGAVVWAAFSPDGTRVVTAGEDGAAKVWATPASEPPAGSGSPVPAEPLTLRHERGGVSFAAFSPDGSKVLTAGDDGTARVWDAATGKAAFPPLRHDAKVAHAAFSPDGSRIVTAGADGKARVWHADGGLPALSQPLEHGGSVTRVAFSPDGRMIATAGDNKLAQVWEAATGRRLNVKDLRHDGAVESVAFSPDGTRLATASRDHGVWIWDLARVPDAKTGVPGVSGTFLRRLRHEGHATSVAFAADGLAIFSAARDGTARLWRVEGGTPLSPPLRQHDARVERNFTPLAVFAPPATSVRPAGQRRPVLALTAGFDTTPQLWDMTPDDRHWPDLRQHAEVLASQHVDETGSYRTFTDAKWKEKWDALRQKDPQRFQPRQAPPAATARSQPAPD